MKRKRPAPLLRGRDAALARDALSDASAAYLALRPRRSRAPDLADGDAGLALVHAGLAGAFPGAGHEERAGRALERAIATLGEQSVRPSLFGGFTGVAWAIEVLGAGDENESENAVDAALTGYLAEEWRGPYDVIEGLAGYGVYALERLPRASARALVGLVVDRLADTAVAPDMGRKGPKRSKGAAWASDPEWVPPMSRATMARWNLGVAHGVPGVIAFLGRVCAADVGARTQKKARTLLGRAVTWVLAQELPAASPTRFPYGRGGELTETPARSAWCYGDPGIAAALFVAARCAGEPTWQREATRIALAAAARPAVDCGVRDASLCHGAAGLGHMFHRLYRGTGQEPLARAARAWFSRALAMRAPGSRPVTFAGWRSLEPNGKGDVTLRPSSSFLTGAGGVTLALLAATGDLEDATWDRALLLSDRESPGMSAGPSAQ